MEVNKDIGNEREDFDEKSEQVIEDVDETASEHEGEIEELNSKLLRLQADFINYRKRSEREREGSIDYGMETIICGLLPILDNFERALDIEVNRDSSFYQGIEMIQTQLIEFLKNNGVEEIDALNKPFDPNYHHAVLMEESEDADEGTIIGVLQKGYIFKEKVIRPSMVRVAQ